MAAIVFTTVVALCLLVYVSADPDSSVVGLLGGTSLLLLAVFTVVNISVLVLRRDKVELPRTPGRRRRCRHDNFYLTLPITGRDTDQYKVAGWLLLLGVILWALTYWHHKRTGTPGVLSRNCPPNVRPPATQAKRPC